MVLFLKNKNYFASKKKKILFICEHAPLVHGELHPTLPAIPHPPPARTPTPAHLRPPFKGPHTDFILMKMGLCLVPFPLTILDH